MLTIDDGRKGVWTTGFPLLRRYGFKATVFLIPGCVPDGYGVDANLEVFWAGRAASNRLTSSDPALMNWHEIRAMHEAGVIDCQSHSHFHHRVPVGSTITGFLSPRYRAASFDLPVPVGWEARLRATGPAASYGLPLFECATLMHVRPRYHPEPAVLDACVARVQGEGGAAFFTIRGAESELRRTYVKAVAEHGPGRFDTPDEIATSVRHDLERSRALIDDALGGALRGHRLPASLLPVYGGLTGSGPAVARGRLPEQFLGHRAGSSRQPPRRRSVPHPAS